jgi:phage terminase large subunit GpA-like protein
MTNAAKIVKAAFKPDPYLDFVEWANAHFRLTKESSVEPGKYRSSRTPWVEEILRELSPQSPTQEVVVIKPTQMAFTTLANIVLCCVAHLYPGPCLFVQPNDEMAKSHSKKKLAPTVRAIPALNGVIKASKSRDSGNTLLLKEFAGGSWRLTGSNSAASARSDSIRYLILDDYDGFLRDLGNEGSPGQLFRNRTDAFGGKRKIYINSTPIAKDESLILPEWEKSSQGHFCVPCPHCHKRQFLVFGGKDADHGIKFTRDDDGQITDVWYVCEHCQSRIEEWQKTEMLAHGKYIHEYPDREKRGFKINSLYSPLGWVSWREIASQFLSAAQKMKGGDTSDMKGWVTTRMADPWEDDGDRPEWAEIKAKAEPYQPLSVPVSDVILLTAGVDVQHNRLAISIYGWKKDEECWLIYHIEIMGDPMQDDVWQQLDSLLFRSFTSPSGSVMRILSAGVDASDGFTTQAVRRYCRTRSPIVFALKGSSKAAQPITGVPTKQDLTWKGEKYINGIEMWPIGTDTAKSTLYARLKLNGHGPRRIHTYIGLDDEFYEQLTAEKNKVRFVKGFPVKEWHNVRGNKRNEALDCFVYAFAAADRAGLQYLDGVPQGQKQATNQPKQAKRPQRNNKTKRERW